MSSKPDKKPDFETALAELEGLVSKLESGDLSLDQSLACFKRGVELTRHCQSAQKNVELLAINADGQAGIEASD
jgi:exodeoxyribonuclease VII small subunit